jgi:lipoprotein signal peptidase
MAERSYRWLLWTLVFLGVTLDQVGKYQVFKALYPYSATEQRIDGRYDHRAKPQVLIEGVFELVAEYTGEPDESTGWLGTLRTYSGPVVPAVNEGALFGFLRDYKHLANSIFAGISVLAALAIAFWSTRRATARDAYLCTALGLILAGTLGNLYDRLVFRGVRDFLHFYWINWPVFNIADCCLVCGASLLLVQAFLRQPARETQQSSVAATAVVGAK